MMRCHLFVCWITIFLFSGSSLLTYGQMTAVLTGNVVDAATGKPMPFTNVYINGSTQGAVTDEKGAYTLTGIPLGTVEIAASFVGYQPATQKIRFDNASPQKANFRLQPSVQTLDAVTIRGNPKSWERNLRQFKKHLFGEPFGGQCVLVNSEVLNFKEDKDHLYATASEPLVIDNQALGYRLIYDLQHFDASKAGKVYSAGTARFEELKPADERQASRFRRNRLIAYHGSIRHLMASLIDNTYEQAGFLVYQEDPSKPIPMERRSITLAAAVSDHKRLVPVNVSKLVQPGKLPTERRLVSPMKLIVFYTKATSGFSPYPDARHAYTEMVLPSGQMQMTVDGVVTMPEGMEAKGSMGNDRLSTMLPADWQPSGDEKTSLASGLLATIGKLAPPDTALERIASTFNERFKLLAPTLYLHIDKSFYSTGDRLWMSAYLLDAASYQREGGETAMHVDLLTSAGKVVQHQWLRMVEGRGEGNFRLSDTLATGMYRLRAYTDEDDAQLGPAFERTLAIYNLFRNDLSAHKDSVARQPDVQVLPEGGRWIAGLPARLGIKVVQPDGSGLATVGRIVDDSGKEVARFKTNRYGMTSVSFEPGAQRGYYAEITYNNQPQRVPLPKAEKDGLLLSADAVSDTTRLMLTVRSANRAAMDSVYILVQQRGQVVDRRKIVLQNGDAELNLPTASWAPGLTQITLYDAGGRPHAERLVFVPESVAPVRVVLGFNKARYQPREQATISVNVTDNGSPALAALSASITDAGKVPDDTSGATLRSHLLLTGELRGRVENPDQYLSEHSAEARQALDELLLTQGWRRVSGTPEAELVDGESLTGRILDTKKQPVPGAHVTLVSTGPGQSFVKSAVADGQGRFRLAGLAIADTVQLMVQVADRKMKYFSAKDVSVILERPGSLWKSDQVPAAPDWSVLRAQLEAARARQDANVDLYRDKAAKELNEVTIRERKYDERPDDIQQRSLHNKADAMVTFNDKSPVYANLYEMIQGNFTGVTVTRTVAGPGKDGSPSGYAVSVRGSNSFKMGTQPLFLIDGVPVRDPDGTVLMNFNPRDIERIEMLKSAGTTGIYGVRGGNGVIAFYSKGARSMQANGKPKDNMTPVWFVGHPSVQREFYVPRYDPEVAANTISGPVDNRDVLYWKPLMQTDSQGRSQLRFPLSDTVRTLRVVIQGITADGRPVVGVQLVQVQ